jgi:hypothetical protein
MLRTAPYFTTAPAYGLLTVYKLMGPGGAAFNVISPNGPLFNFLA